MRLELRGVTAGYGATSVLRDVNVVVPEGRVVALLGPNGAGKTTTLSVASGLLTPESGSVLLDRRDVTSAGTDQRAGHGLCHITAGRSIFRNLDVGDNLRMFSPHKQEATAIAAAVDAFPRLGERMNQIAGTMSGGEQQMLALARAYVSGAPTVLLDEVSMGLAPIIVEQIFDFLGRLAGEGRSLLLVEQYVSKALALADIVYVLVRGRIVFVGEPDELRGSDVFDRYMGEAAGVT
jgi:branched-chain amino acid transport system ATP-binding protein